MPKKSKDAVKVEELTADLQRLRADFENYRKRVEQDKAGLATLTKAATIMKLLPIVDTIERAIAHAPDDLDKSLAELGLNRIEADPGTAFDPNLHEAVLMEDGEGEHEVVAEELRTGYKLGDQVVRPSMVKVTHGELKSEDKK
jgi:molecular chaperone GrpE